jgi:hypothetical protein
VIDVERRWQTVYLAAGQQRMMEALAPHVASILKSGCTTNAAGRSSGVRVSDSRSSQDQRAWSRASAAAQYPGLPVGNEQPAVPAQFRG